MSRRRRAHPFRALFRADCRMLRRHGIALLYAFLALLYAAVLRFLAPEGQRPLLTTLLLLTDPAVMSLFFMGAVVLYEKNQHIHGALYVSAVRPRSWVLSKCLCFSLLGTLAGCFIQWFSNPAVLRGDAGGGMAILYTLGDGDLTALYVTLACMLLGGALFTCLSVAPAVAVRSLNGFILAVAVAEVALLLPAVIELFWPLPEYAGYHPAVLLARALYRPDQVSGWLGQPEKLKQCAAFLGWLGLAWGLALGFGARLIKGGGAK